MKRWDALISFMLQYVVTALALLLVAPVLLLIAILVKLTSQGPIFYTQERVGKRGRLFKMIKFRTMVVGAERLGLGIEVAKQDDRITPLGRILRRYSLDELPQLFNVLKGDMNLIGPRATLKYQVDRYTPYQRRRLEVNPGLTGWAQVNGRNSVTWDERINMDIWYIDHWSPLLDLKILMKTPKAIFSAEGVYGKDGIVREKV